MIRERFIHLIKDGKQIAFMRHGETSPLTEYQKKLNPHQRDLCRKLSTNGKNQCRSQGLKYFKELDASNVFISSRAKRCRLTARYFYNDYKYPVDCQVSKEIYPEVKKYPKMKELFEKLSYDTLNNYYLNGGQEELAKYSDRVMEDIQKVYDLNERGKIIGKTIFIFGHAIYLNQVALEMGNILKLNGDFLKDTKLQEAEIILVNQNEIKLLK